MINSLVFSALFLFVDPGHLVVDIKFYDWTFMQVQENWMIDQTPGLNAKEINLNKIPNNILKWIRQLDANCYTCREIACKKLKKLPDEDFRYLFRAYKYGSEEQKKHLYHILTWYAKCRNEDHLKEDKWCSECRGNTQFWPLDLLQESERCIGILERFEPIKIRGAENIF